MSTCNNLNKFIFGALLFGIAASASATTNYIFTDLGIKGAYGEAHAINNLGQIVGYSTSTGNGFQSAVLWNGVNRTYLNDLSGSFSYSRAYGINNNGQIVGDSTNDRSVIRSTLWSDNSIKDLGEFSNAYKDASYSYASAINDHGQVVGTTRVSFDAFHATLWNGNTSIDLGTLGGTTSFARGINDAGQVVGYSRITGDITNHATLWNGTTAIDLGSLGGEKAASNAYAINNSSKIVGGSTNAQGVYHATLWSNGEIFDLGELGGGYSEAVAINNVGQIVGRSSTSDFQTHATLWNGTSIIDLNTLLDTSTINAGWVLYNANDINDFGWIVGSARNYMTGASTSYLLSLAPVPEPESYAMMLVGLSFIIGFTRRKKHYQA